MRPIAAQITLSTAQRYLETVPTDYKATGLDSGENRAAIRTANVDGSGHQAGVTQVVTETFASHERKVVGETLERKS